jgi:glyoxylase-like metal-dependent hydrolase (beta-lactamase superfamily II)
VTGVLLLEPLSLWVAATNAWIVAPNGPGGECIVVDAPPEPEPLLARLSELELRLVALITTHGHIDHVGGVGSVVRDPRGGGHAGDAFPVHIHDADRHMLVDLVAAGGMMANYLEGVDTRPPELIEGLDDGTVVRGAGMELRALHTPGHTQGSVCLRLDVEDAPPLLFSGDHLFAGSIGRTDLPGGDFEQLMASMAEKILPLDDDVTVLPGHGPATTIGRERRTNPFVLELLSR